MIPLFNINKNKKINNKKQMIIILKNHSKYQSKAIIHLLNKIVIIKYPLYYNKPIINKKYPLLMILLKNQLISLPLFHFRIINKPKTVNKITTNLLII